MSYFSQRHGSSGTDLPLRSHHTKSFLSAKMNEFVDRSRPPHLLKSSEAEELQEYFEHPNVAENGAKPIHSLYNDDDDEDEECLEKAHNVSVYGNPLWTEEQISCHSKDKSFAAVALDDKHDANLLVNGDTKEVLEEENGCQSISLLPQNDYLMYSSDSSDEEGFCRDGARDVPFWKPQFYDIESRSTSQNSSNFEFNPSLEGKDFHEQQIPMQGNLKASNLFHAKRNMDSDKGKSDMLENLTEESGAPREESARDSLKNKLLSKHEEDRITELDSSKFIRNSHGWSKNFSELFFKESNDPQKCRPEQCDAISKTTNDPTRGHKKCLLPHQPHCDLAASDGRNMFASILANNRQGMFWSNESLKKDMSSLSPQEEDYLYQNSDLLASFEVKDYGTTNRRVAKERELAKEDFLQNGCKGKFFKENDSIKNDNAIEEFCDVDNAKEKGQMLYKTKEIRQFDDTSSWSSENSKELNSHGHLEVVRPAFDALPVKDCINLAMVQSKENFPLSKNVSTVLPLPIPDDSALSSTTIPCHRDDRLLPSRPQELGSMEKLSLENKVATSPCGEMAQPNTAVPQHIFDEKTSKSMPPQEFQMMEKPTRDSNVVLAERNMKDFEQEVLELRKENGRLSKLLKESKQKLDNSANERVLWEQKKLSEMSIFNEFKENETQRLKRERTKLEKQVKLLAQLPSKKERNEIEELRGKIANLTSEHAKKESVQNLTINRLRRTITDLTEQIYTLQEEVKRYERFLHSELDANQDSRRKPNLPKITAAEIEQEWK